jgi:hypothetical protein
MIEVPGVTIESIFQELELQTCDYLKIDCEGAEYDILFNTNKAILSKIRHICLEYHNGVTSFSHVDLVHFFQINGFHVETHPNPAHRYLGFLHAVNPNLK